jgi:hypothetical protein
MNLLNLLNDLIVRLNALIRATSDPLQQAQLSKLRDAFDAMSDSAVHQLFDVTSPDFSAATSALQSASAAADQGVADLTKVSTAINSAVTAANAVDKVLGFLAHIA